MLEQGYGSVAIVTGCSSGIGFATTLLFLKHQFLVFGVDVKPFDYKSLDVLEGGRYQEKFHFHLCDLTKEGECETAISICVGAFGAHIDVLANIAGVADTLSSADTISPSEWNHVLAVNLTAPVTMMRAVLPFMKEKHRGAIINVASRAGVSGAAAGIACTASKHGLIGASKNVAWRFHNEGIRCNVVMPGGVATNLSASMDPTAVDTDAYSVMRPVHNLHTPIYAKPDIQATDVADAILFLVSEEAKMINGVVLPVDRAWSVI